MRSRVTTWIAGGAALLFATALAAQEAKTITMRRLGVLVTLGGLVTLAAFNLASAQDTKADAPLPHDVGQSVTPSFEGWYPNSDGTFSLVFGYFNRNYEEYLDIPVGPNNRIEPGLPDQGQPTHFLPRRQTGVFAAVVPADFGDQRLTWTLTAHGEAISSPGHLRLGWEITALEEVTSGNTPPVLKFGSDAKSGQGPLGTKAKVRATVASPTPITVWASDDGVRRVRRQSERSPTLGLGWSKYRGPGTVTFSESQPSVDGSGKAVTNVTFSEPGEYVLRVLAWDDSGGQGVLMAGGFFCCWTNGYVTVNVQSIAVDCR
jgi:hypothetical protein